MNQQDFEDITQRLLDIKRDEDNLNKAFRQFDPDFNYISFSRYEALVVDTLQKVMGDVNDWIGYFLYERNGMFTDESPVKDKNGDVSFSNLGDLYRLITHG